MSEAELFSVQKVTPEIANASAQLHVLNGVVASAAVGFIADDGMFEPREMNANLVRASGLELDVEERETVETLPHAIKRERAASTAYHRDRKSTRLNSSHSQISYAVFCL